MRTHRKASDCFILCYPYLRLQDQVVIGDYKLVPFHAFHGPWWGEEAKELAELFVARFKTPGGRAHPAETVLVHVEHGMDGKLPPEPLREVMQSAIQFAALADNSVWRSSGEFLRDAHIYGYDKHRRIEDFERDMKWWQQRDVLITTENVTRCWWRLTRDEEVAFEKGAILPIGHGLGPNTPIVADHHLVETLDTISLDAELVQAALTAFQQRPALLEAANIYSLSMQNSESVSASMRLRDLHTAFEILHQEQTRGGDKVKQAKWVESRFNATIPLSRADDSDTLWRYDQRSIPITVDGRSTCKSPFQHWFISSYVARNDLTHRGRLADWQYTPGVPSVYAGPYFYVAARVLRDLLLSELGSTMWMRKESRTTVAEETSGAGAAPGRGGT